MHPGYCHRIQALNWIIWVSGEWSDLKHSSHLIFWASIVKWSYKFMYTVLNLSTCKSLLEQDLKWAILLCKGKVTEKTLLSPPEIRNKSTTLVQFVGKSKMETYVALLAVTLGQCSHPWPKPSIFKPRCQVLDVYLIFDLLASCTLNVFIWLNEVH